MKHVIAYPPTPTYNQYNATKFFQKKEKEKIYIQQQVYVNHEDKYFSTGSIYMPGNKPYLNTHLDSVTYLAHRNH